MVWNIVCDSSCDLRATDVKSESVQFETVPLRLTSPASMIRSIVSI